MPECERRWDHDWFWAHCDTLAQEVYNPETQRFERPGAPPAHAGQTNQKGEKGERTMSNLIVKGEERNRYPLLEAGGYLARCYAIIDIGEQYNKIYDNYSRKVVFVWELPTETIEVDGAEKPRAISETYTMSLGEKSNLRKMLENWRGRAFTAQELDGFDLETVLGAPCMLNVLHKAKQNGEPFAKIGSVSKLPKGMTAPELVNPKRLFSLEDAGALETMGDLPEWMQNRIRESRTYRELRDPKENEAADNASDDFAVIDAGDGDIPF